MGSARSRAGVAVGGLELAGIPPAEGEGLLAAAVEVGVTVAVAVAVMVSVAVGVAVGV
jgi:hypothetical protein